MLIRRRTRETLRHERACVLQQKNADQMDPLALTPAQIRANTASARALRLRAKREGKS